MAQSKKDSTPISKKAMQRMPYYLQYLDRLASQGSQYASAPMLAKALGLHEVQVRKDLAAVSRGAGKPQRGFVITELTEDIREFLGYNNCNEAILVGVGHLGSALLAYRGFEKYGVKIIAAFDREGAPERTGSSTVPVFPLEKLPGLCKRMSIHLAVLTVPEQEAQAVCDILVQGGILGILNFAPVHLRVPEGVIVQNENLASSLSLLSKQLQERLQGGVSPERESAGPG